YRVMAACRGRERADVQPERLAKGNPDEPFEDSVHVDEEDAGVDSAGAGLEPGGADDEPGECDCGPVPVVEPGPVRFRYAAPGRGQGADAVELQAQPGQGGAGVFVPQVQPSEGVHGGAEKPVFQDVGGEVV